MKQFAIHRELMGAALTAQAVRLPDGLQVGVYGGTLPHLGAVSVVDPNGICTTIQFPGHKDGVVSERWAEALSEAGYRPTAVTAGIHYDDLSREQIAKVVERTDDMLSELLDALSNEKKWSTSEQIM